MLPSLSDNWGVRLQVMIPIAIDPANVSVMKNMILDLKKIDAIRVSYSGKTSQAPYAVEVSADLQQQVSTGARQAGSPAARTGGERGVTQAALRFQRPTGRIEKTLDQFKDLRNEVYDIAHSAHRSQHCEFCTSILEWTVFGMNLDSFFLLMLSGERVALKLTKFVTDLLACIVQHNATNTQVICAGLARVPQVVHAFLFASA